MAGLDQSGDEGMKQEALQEIALPILTNMAASFLELRRPKQALELCDQALGIDSECVKAHLRKGKALLDLDRYAESRVAFDAALAKSKTPGEIRDSEVYRRKTTEVNKRAVAETAKYVPGPERGALLSLQVERFAITCSVRGPIHTWRA